MLDKQCLDLRDVPLNSFNVTSNGGFATLSLEYGDKELEIQFSYKQKEKIDDEYRYSIGEDTHECKDNKILKLYAEVEELEEKLEIQEQHYEVKMEKLNEGYPF